MKWVCWSESGFVIQNFFNAAFVFVSPFMSTTILIIDNSSLCSISVQSLAIFKG